ncbi:MAG: hypothetical protein E6J90_21705 [Deltaproteobacteria bacterium]|nr:MAG: hypothetical protein E6J90_21705 [Deltaproteobacteria bacterium]
MRRLAFLLATWMMSGQLAAAEPRHNQCEFTVTGDATASVTADVESTTANGKVMAASDYWNSEAELRKQIAFAVGGGKLGDAEKQRKIDEWMKHDPRLLVLAINCLTDDGGITVRASVLSKYADVPLRPGSYSIASEGTERAREFSAKLRFTAGGKRESYWVDSGKLVLSQFDKRGLAGTFTLKARDRINAKHVEVTGRFKYACAGEACER